MNAASLFRQSSRAFSSRALSRASTSTSASHRLPSFAVARRTYADDATSKDKEAADAAKANGESPAQPESELEKKLAAKEAEVVDLTGRLRYLQADFVNLQRNSAREKEQTKDFAISRFAQDLLETVDVLALALKSVPESALSSDGQAASDASAPDTKTPQERLIELHRGVELTQRSLLATLFKYHVKPFDPTGEPFDPNRHEALYQVPVPGKTPGSVIDCQKTGYMIKDRVLRAAQVGVAQDTS